MKFPRRRRNVTADFGQVACTEASRFEAQYLDMAVISRLSKADWPLDALQVSHDVTDMEGKAILATAQWPLRHSDLGYNQLDELMALTHLSRGRCPDLQTGVGQY